MFEVVVYRKPDGHGPEPRVNKEGATEVEKSERRSKASGRRIRNDSLWFEAVDEAYRRKFEDLGLGDKELPKSGSGFLIFEFLAEDLLFLQDGKLNLLIGEDEALDWAILNIVLATGQRTDDREQKTEDRK